MRRPRFHTRSLRAHAGTVQSMNQCNANPVTRVRMIGFKVHEHNLRKEEEFPTHGRWTDRHADKDGGMNIFYVHIQVAVRAWKHVVDTRL